MINIFTSKYITSIGNLIDLSKLEDPSQDQDLDHKFQSSTDPNPGHMINKKAKPKKKT